MSQEPGRDRLEPTAKSQAAPTQRLTNTGSDSEPVATQKRVRKRKTAPQSLAEYYSGRTGDPRQLLWVLGDRDPKGPSPEDVDAALNGLAKRDRDLVKTRSLALYAANSDEGRLAPFFRDFFVRVVESEFQDTHVWPPQQGADGSDIFRKLLSHHRTRLRRKVVPRRFFNAVMIAQAILCTSHGLPIQDAATALADALGPPAAFGADRRDTRTRPRALGNPVAPVEATRTWLDVLSPWIRIALEQERRAQAAESQAGRLMVTIESLERDLAEARHDHDRATGEIAQLSEDLRGAKLARQHDVSQLRDSMAGFIRDDLSAQLAAAREGLSLDPPRVTYSLERLDDAKHAIDSKVKWLKSSD